MIVSGEATVVASMWQRSGDGVLSRVVSNILYFGSRTKEEKMSLKYTNFINCFYINLIIKKNYLY